ncbi:hypothetical protein BCR32DRAFT_284176 [Anaeromyces robustus]|uniref:Uncharacterized protein n=1 Tax=Anaeromyces robustus TaxID=1754192 RepID=A0A1Y1WSB1_9FUNG|nr:hypothetical protein BCR32DRAFT_284176 [Anaeromyces robustus]|eukprot:ORX76417.1 hypothetical protein BCR32DRAFT_284176 [Anaeromyces robustus]
MKYGVKGLSMQKISCTLPKFPIPYLKNHLRRNTCTKDNWNNFKDNVFNEDKQVPLSIFVVFFGYQSVKPNV